MSITSETVTDKQKPEAFKRSKKEIHGFLWVSQNKFRGRSGRLVSETCFRPELGQGG